MSAAQSVAAAVQGLKLNIGCGLSGIPGWYNIDNSPTVLLSRLPMGQRLFRTPAWPRDVRRINVLRGLPFLDESVLYIYSSHLLQGLTPAESRGLLQECFRVLRSGGVLRIVVPDLERVVKDYLADPDTAASHKLMRRLSPKSSPIRDLLRKGRRYEQMFDARSLAELLAEAGFKDARACEFKQSRIAEIDVLEVERRRSESLYVEASK
jgi:predicted SAM-dependent methyltransferase